MKNLTILENIDLTINDLAYQLTAYEQWGIINYEDGIIDLIINEYLEQAETYELFSSYNEFLEEIQDYDNMYYYNDEDFFNTYFSHNPMEVARATFYGDYRYCDDYVKFNAYGNLESCEEWELIRKIKENQEFKKWLYSNDDAFEELREEDIRNCIVNKTFNLVKEGY